MLFEGFTELNQDANQAYSKNSKLSEISPSNWLFKVPIYPDFCN